MISCEQYAKEIKEALKSKITQLECPPRLAIIQVGDDPASNSYVKGKLNDCKETWIDYNYIKCDKYISEVELLGVIDKCNKDVLTHGIIVQLPLPKHLDADKITNHIAKEKDVDGFRPDSPFDPCTPKGIIDWLEYNDYKFEGKLATVVGRSKIVGKPLVNMLIDKGCTVTCCNSHTEDLYLYTTCADLLITAIGKPKYFRNPDIVSDTVVVDVGINRDENGKLCGDVDREDILNATVNTYITPVPKGVGLLTRVALLQNVYDAYMNGGN
jgi:methylenetetrahydrofolate dehydrogenase (NADP+)/methenyltetrahydrofolate cyclohydrolase